MLFKALHLLFAAVHGLDVSVYLPSHLYAHEMADLLLFYRISVLLVEVVLRNHGLRFYCFRQSYGLFAVLPRKYRTF